MIDRHCFRDVARDRGSTHTPACHADGIMVRATIVVALFASAVTHAEPDPAVLVKEVARVRGLKLRRPIPAEYVDRTELRKRLLDHANEGKTAAQTAIETLALQRWGFVPLDYDYGAKLVDLLADQIAGYYDPEKKQLTILDAGSASAGGTRPAAPEDPQWSEMVLAHELDHGLQDQAFDLAKFEQLPEEDSDALAARHALVEGDGIALMLEVVLARQGARSPWSVPAAAAAVVAAMNEQGAHNDALDEAPFAIREGMLSPYRDGFAFVAALRRTRPWSAVDAAFKRPPRSMEQILHPEKYLADDPPIVVVAGESPLAGYAVIGSEVWGELGVRSFLRSHGVGEETATRAAAGWGGDRAILLAKPGERVARRAIGMARLEWDTELDAREAQAALEHAVDAMSPGATIEQSPMRTRWLALDGTVSVVERSGQGVAVVVGAPVQLADKLDPFALLSVKRKR